MNSSHPKVLLYSKLLLCDGFELRQNQEVICEEKIQINKDMFAVIESGIRCINKRKQRRFVILMILIVKPEGLANIILYLLGINSSADHQQGSPFLIFNIQFI
tara:strand:- start:326 stop:634 length:309 start_codon:yes stop_codon:yes gene_type:complete